MKILGSAHFLGLEFGDRSIRAAEVTRDGTVVRAAEYLFPQDTSLEHPEALGDGLRDFLRAHRFSASRAVAGLPARWLLARGREIPPMTAALAGDALRMQAERDLSMAIDELVLDYAGKVDAKEARRVLLVAVLGQHLDRVVRICRGAGLRLLAVTASTLTLTQAMRDGSQDGIVVSITLEAAEVLVQKNGTPGSLRHFAVNGHNPLRIGEEPRPGCLEGLGIEIRRELALMPGGPVQGELLLWDGIGIGSEEAAALGERIGLRVSPGDLASLGAIPAPEAGDSVARASAAVALALAGARRDLLAVDFLHSRCAPPRKRRWGRRTAALAALAAALALGGLLLIVDLGQREADLAAMKERLLGMKADIQEAEVFVKNNKSLVQGWYDARPHPLDLLKRVTLAFPEEGRVWATSFSATEGLKGTISGKAVDQKSILTVLDRLKADPSLSDVMLADMRETGSGSKVVSFTLSFTYRAPEVIQ